ncbi:unnamed protein product, partial [Musa textilis]
FFEFPGVGRCYHLSEAVLPPVRGGSTACQSGRLTQQVLGGATVCLGRFHHPGLGLWAVPPPRPFFSA